MVKIVKLDQLNRIGKFMQLSMSKGEARERLMKYHALNVKSYYKNKKRKYQKCTIYKMEDFVFSTVPLVSSVQAVADLEVLHFNCLDLDDGRSWDVIQDMLSMIALFKSDYDYDVMKRYERFISY